jgi:hypothetical protein
MRVNGVLTCRVCGRPLRQAPAITWLGLALEVMRRRRRLLDMALWVAWITLLSIVGAR